MTKFYDYHVHAWRAAESWKPKRFPEYRVNAFGDCWTPTHRVASSECHATTWERVAPLAPPSRPLRGAPLPAASKVVWQFPRAPQRKRVAVAEVEITASWTNVAGKWWGSKCSESVRNEIKRCAAFAKPIASLAKV